MSRPISWICYDGVARATSIIGLDGGLEPDCINPWHLATYFCEPRWARCPSGDLQGLPLCEFYVRLVMGFRGRFRERVCPLDGLTSTLSLAVCFQACFYFQKYPFKSMNNLYCLLHGNVSGRSVNAQRVLMRREVTSLYSGSWSEDVNALRHSFGH